MNEGYGESCLEVAEELANQTPVRLDLLLSLIPPSTDDDVNSKLESPTVIGLSLICSTLVVLVVVIVGRWQPRRPPLTCPNNLPAMESRLLLIRHLVPFHLAVLLIKFRVGSIKI